MKVSNEVLAILSESAISGDKLILQGQLDRKIYQQVAKVLEAAGWMWNRKAQAHVCVGDDAEAALDQVLLTGVATSIKDEFNCFYSPNAICVKAVDLADVRRGMRVLEPSAGTGHIVEELLAHGAIVDCVEILAQNAKALAALNPLGHLYCTDFLTMEPKPIYDRVVMNPPFTKQQDIKHVLHALKFLKPGGRLVAIMSASMEFRNNKLTNEFRDVLFNQYDGIAERLPDGSFKSSGTMVNTVMIAAEVPA